jgi:NAD(P)-dependent dehydrogenase (short-subunit alcohol dehydrogenase family)
VKYVSKVLITGSSDGLGLAAAEALIEQGHEVVLHARTEARADHTRRRAPGAATVLVADLASRRQTLELAERANERGAFDAVIHNAGVGYREPRRVVTEDGLAQVLAINVVAPYLLTARMLRPQRLIYLSSGMHFGGTPSVEDINWEQRTWNGAQAYSDSKLFDATLAAAVARRWSDVVSTAVEPGWVATKMGGPGAPDDLSLAHVTQVWLATSREPAAQVTGGYYYHRRAKRPAAWVRSSSFQDELIGVLRELTGVELSG